MWVYIYKGNIQGIYKCICTHAKGTYIYERNIYIRFLSWCLSRDNEVTLACINTCVCVYVCVSVRVSVCGCIDFSMSGKGPCECDLSWMVRDLAARKSGAAFCVVSGDDDRVVPVTHAHTHTHTHTHTRTHAHTHIHTYTHTHTHSLPHTHTHTHIHTNTHTRTRTHFLRRVWSGRLRCTGQWGGRSEGRERNGESGRKRERVTQTDRQTDSQIDRQTDRQTD